jgi:hypothetical protein
MGRIGRNRRGLQVTSRVTWTFSARAPGLGGTPLTPFALPGRRGRTARAPGFRPARAMEQLVTALLVRPALRALRPHPHRHAPHARRHTAHILHTPHLPYVPRALHAPHARRAHRAPWRTGR